jgi:hypothetical protein
MLFVLGQPVFLVLRIKKPDGVIKKQSGVKINIRKKNLISELSHYADTPNCLYDYLNPFIEN